MALVFRSSALRAPTRSDTIDAVTWTLVTLVVLATIPIGIISGDGLYQSGMYVSGQWFWNPNHLLYEPLGAWWQTTLRQMHAPRTPPDQLKWLSILMGSLTLGIFRAGIAGPITSSRLRANLATAWVATCAAFAGLWVSDETQIVQMPFLALAGAALLKYFRAPSLSRIALIAGAAALATLFYVSHALVIMTLAGAVLLFQQRRGATNRGFRDAFVLGTEAVCIVFVVMWSAWRFTAPHGTRLMRWLTSYGGGHSGQLATSFGIQWTPGGIVTAVARAVYGTALAVVDVTRSVDDARVHTITTMGCLAAMALAAAVLVLGIAATALWRRRREDDGWDTLLLVTAYAVSTLVFGIYWNNSDDQFFFQLVLPIGALIASYTPSLQRRTLWLAANVVVLGWNAYVLLTQLILYPRWAYVDALEKVVGHTPMVIFPGEDEASRLLHFVPSPPSQQRLALTTIADHYQARAGIPALAALIDSTLAHGNRIDAVAVYDVRGHVPPWKHLSEVGYTATALRQAIRGTHALCGHTMAGPFAVYSFAATPSNCSSPVKP